MSFDLRAEIEEVTHAIYGIPMNAKVPCRVSQDLSRYEHAQMLADREPVEIPDFSQEDWAHDAFGEKQAKAISELFSLRDSFLGMPVSEDVKRFLTAIRKIELAAYAEVMDK